MTTVAAVVVAAAAMVTAGVAFTVVVVVIALHIGVEAEGACQQVCNRCIGITAAATVQSNACLSQGHLCTTANTAADQHICFEIIQQTCQCAVAAAIGIHYLRGDDRAVFHFIDFELLGVTEVLEDLTVSVSNCDFHDTYAPLK